MSCEQKLSKAYGKTSRLADYIVENKGFMR